MATYDNKVLTGDKLLYFAGLIKSALAGKQDSLVFNTAYNSSSNKVATMSDIPDVSGKQDALVFNTAYNASSNKVATMSDVNGKQDSLVFNTAYNASSNKVATMADVPTSIDDFMWGYDEEEPAPVGDTLDYFNEFINGIAADDGSSVASNAVKVDEDAQTGDPITLDTVLSNLSSGKQDSLVFNTAYNASSNKVATMSDITSAISGIGAFSFEIVQTLPSSNISTSKIYLVPKSTSGTNQVYTEYAYVNNAWEIIGDTSMSLDTLTNSEIDSIWSAASAS